MKNIIRYKDFIGSVHFSSDDEIFFGKIEGIDRLVTFEGTTVVKLKKSFKDVVDDYLQICSQISKSPQKSYKGSFNVRIPSELHKKVAEKALFNGIPLNNLV
jgi:predicted HicB family RNase H-like nuclease